MTPAELRALADALIECGEDAWPTPPEPIQRAADYLRAQADAQPVAEVNDRYSRDGYNDEISVLLPVGTKLYTQPAAPAGWKLVPVEPTPEMLSAVGMMDGYDWHAPGCSPDADHANWYSAMIAAAPAAPQAEPDDDALVLGEPDMLTPEDVRRAVPQAEPIDPHMIVAEDRFPDVPAEQWVTCSQCDGDFDRECPICDGLGKVLATDGEQAEPKREPLTDERIAEIQRAAYERAAQECHAQKGGLSSEWGDGHDTGCDDCFAAIRALGGQHD